MIDLRSYKHNFITSCEFKNEKDFRLKRDRLAGLNGAVVTTGIAEVMGSNPI